MPARPRVPAHLIGRELERHQRHRDAGPTVSGHHNDNLVVRLSPALTRAAGEPDGLLGTFRTPRKTVQVVPRMWRDEAEVLTAVHPYLAEVPRYLGRTGNTALYTYVEGAPLSARAPRGTALGDRTLVRMASVFGQLSTVPEKALPPRPAGWPEDGDSAGFLEALVTFTERHVHQANEPDFGRLFKAVGIPSEAMEIFREQAGTLVPRPFGLLHTDLHRDNLIETPAGGLAVIDWEIALYGDPLHDLATHLVRMGYTDRERELLVELWRGQLARRGHHARLAGLKTDLELYVDFEIAQSVYADTLRAALSLPPRAGGARLRTALDRAARDVRRALTRARGPLRMLDPVSVDDVREALHDWYAEHAPAVLRAEPAAAPVPAGTAVTAGTAVKRPAGVEQPPTARR
ncbi:hypothetical protein CUT44_12650 [Streptomyces carminius]|uniref:Aminoglycoside phosphotransferase domain-containing protein n=1 Tax=Streptomyces carminius TaxID=2665496 RepID=A0A2M8LZY9_9ACTN|nr:phosphotransferase [Streptomyces carminius]PJE97518.1 hypothetical protein CUT44_12650 [Streptomyces carminius]